MSYQFSLIRFVPDPARGEFVNIGAIVGDPEAEDWETRFISNYRRAKALDPGGVLPAAVAFTAGLDERVGAFDQLPDLRPEPLSLDSLRRMAEEMQNVVQLTAPAPVAADSAEDALDLIFDQLIVDPASRRHRFEKKHRAQQSTRKAYRAHDVPPEAVTERAKVVSGVYDDTFDFAVHNGRALQLVQCWSFQLPNQNDLAEQVKAWSWVVHELRESGGSMTTDTGELPVAENTEITAVCILPKDGGSPAYEEARAAFQENQVSEVTPETADQIGARAAQLLAAQQPEPQAST